TPSAFRNLIPVAKATDEARALRLVIFGGEALALSSLQPWIERFGDERPQLINMYGITETTVHVTERRISSNDLNLGSRIGAVLGDLQAYVLDRQQHPVPVGVAGELYVGGAGVGRGYLNRPEITAEIFGPNPFGPGRLYRTGDLARYREDGDLEYLGRADHQVKVRGYRIELGEIEAALRSCSGVKQAVVLMREQRLVGYVVSEEVSSSELRAQLSEKLPQYMVPAVIVELAELPLTANGKLDRKALPEPELSGREHHYEGPRTPVEELLAGIFAEVLKLERVGRDENFFELGGHSLLAAQLIARAEAAFSVEIPLRVLFDAPSVADLAEQIEKLRRDGRPSLPPLTRHTNGNGSLPLSFAQQRLWFIDQLEPGNFAYQVPAALRLIGDLDRIALQRSLTEIARRHDVLRTSFAVVNGEPVQVVGPAAEVPLPERDLSDIPEPDRFTEALRLVDEEISRPFDLATGPLVRVLLLAWSEREHILVITMHHIVCDARSMEIMIREFRELYRAFSQGQASPLSDLPIQYADYAYWQRQWLQGSVLNEQLDYWKQQLSAAAPLELSTDHSRPIMQTYRGAAKAMALAPAVGESIREKSRQWGTTPFLTTLAAFKALLRRYTSQDDISIGTPITNRRQLETEDLIGFFLNTLVLRTDLSGNPSFQQLLGNVREVALSGFAHQDIPFEKLVEEVGPQRDLSRSALFQVMFVCRSAGQEDNHDLNGLVTQPISLDTSTAKFDLTFFVEETPNNWHTAIEYNMDLFEPASAERVLQHFQALLESALNDPERPLSDLPLLTDAERQQMIVEWNDTATKVDKFAVHELLEAQARVIPDACAIVCEDQYLTYNGLNSAANKMAHYLQRLGAGRETLVGVCMERSVEMVVALLGILKAGGAYVPLDPTFPEERLSFMLNDSQVDVILTQQSVAASLPESAARVIRFDVDRDEIFKESKRNPSQTIEAEQLAYVLYTSGSTGRPKGVQITHRSLSNFLNSTRREPGVSERDVMVAVTTLSFDIAGLEIFLPLTVGAQVVIADRKTASDGAALSDLLAERNATVMQATPATWRMLVASGWQGNDMLKVLCGGEAFPLDLAGELVTRSKSVWNLYGPTETTIWSAVTELDHTQPDVSIGHPLDNTQFYVLDEFLNPVPIGVAGELYIGGEGLARGYLNRPELTSEKFVPDFLSGRAAATLYRTGDVVRYLEDGKLEFLRRLDHQVKVRGFRIELGEVETALSQYPSMIEVVALVREQQLVAYFVCDPGREPTVNELIAFLKERLPEYMIPTTFVKLEALPLTLNGKIDRGALAAVTHAPLEPATAFVAPRTAAEEVIADVCAEVLQVETIGVFDNFFERGGHSLSATRVIFRLREVFRVELPLRTLFESPTVMGLVEALAREWGDPTVVEEIADLYLKLKYLPDEQINDLAHTVL
ncbi:MAG TPA: amino acid adenylation domain-containing protein, partial [Pyrinomonadaceae bacterium]|nr:amino acid adenylation domain-containing protein [Pyrinomonadaceae bacterium]